MERRTQNKINYGEQSMNFKKPREQVAKDAAHKAFNAIQSNMHQHNNGNLSGIGYSISQAVQMGIEEAIKSMIEDMYTDVEFEEDLQLRDKR